MEATISEIAPEVFRISVFPPGAPVSFGCFLIRDEQPAMVETGLRGVYGLVHDAVRRLVDPATLRYLLIPHFEMDECGSLNQFLALAPQAEPVCSPLGAAVTVSDFSERPARALSHGEMLALGRKTLRAVVTPWVHYWDSMLVYDETDRLLFTSDLFMQPGDREPITSDDRSAEVVQFCRFSGLLPSQKHLEVALDRVEPLAVDTLACHHGSVLAGDPWRYYRALREQAVGDVVGAPFYDLRPSGGPGY
jgi:flavorubredoxin